MKRHPALVEKAVNMDKSSGCQGARLVFAPKIEDGVFQPAAIVIAVEKYASRLQGLAYLAEETREAVAVTRFMDCLKRDDRIEAAESSVPFGLLEIAKQEFHLAAS